MYSFKTKIEHRNIDVYKIKPHLCINEDIDVDLTCVGLVEWTMEIETREWGVKDISCVIKSVSVQIEYEYFNDDDSLIRECLEVNEKLLILEDNLRCEGGCIKPESIVINFEKNRIIVS